MNQELQVAVLFTKILQDDKVELFIPARILIGTTDINNLLFYDILSHAPYNNLDSYCGEENYCGFYYSRSLKKFNNDTSQKEIFQELSTYLKEIKEKAYYYSLEDGSTTDFYLKSMPIEDFKKKYNINISYPYVASDIDKVDFSELNKIGKELQKSLMDDYQEQDLGKTIIPIDEVYDKIRKNVLCQDNQIKRILTAIYKNIIFDNSKIKSNIFIYGPTGVGKTAILNQISTELNIPVVIEDANFFTIAGYRGKDCEEALRHLYFAADGNLELAQRGILVFDEIDKKNKKSDSDDGVSTEGVLNSLLKISEGGTFEVEIDKTTDGKIMFDTSHLTVIVSGAFEKMFTKQKNTGPIGFGNLPNVRIDNNNSTIVKQFINYGMPKEFIGRFNTFVPMNSLGKEDLKHILLNSESSYLKVYIDELAQLGITLKLDDSLIERISDMAYERQTGARALNNIVSDILDENILYDIFKFKMDKKEITLDASILKEKKLVLKNTVQQ